MRFRSRDRKEFVDSDPSMRVKNSGESRFSRFRVWVFRIGFRSVGREGRSDLSENSDWVNGVHVGDTEKITKFGETRAHLSERETQCTYTSLSASSSFSKKAPM